MSAAAQEGWGWGHCLFSGHSVEFEFTVSRKSHWGLKRGSVGQRSKVKSSHKFYSGLRPSLHHQMRVEPVEFFPFLKKIGQPASEFLIFKPRCKNLQEWNIYNHERQQFFDATCPFATLSNTPSLKMLLCKPASGSTVIFPDLGCSCELMIRCKYWWCPLYDLRMHVWGSTARVWGRVTCQTARRFAAVGLGLNTQDSPACPPFPPLHSPPHPFPLIQEE